jgi:hypothetical protein
LGELTRIRSTGEGRIEVAKRGRPSKKTDALCEEIALRLSEGEPMAEICRSAHMPSVATVFNWMADDHEFTKAIARARDIGYDRIAVDALRIADTPVIGTIEVEGGDGKTTLTRKDAIEHRKLQVDTRLKLLAKWCPKRYGERVQHSGDPDAPIQHAVALDFSSLKPEERNALRGILEARQNTEKSDVEDR